MVKKTFIIILLLGCIFFPATATVATESDTCIAQGLLSGVRGLPPNDETCYGGALDAQNKTNGVACETFTHACCRSTNGQIRCLTAGSGFTPAPPSSTATTPSGVATTTSETQKKAPPIIFDPEITLPFFPKGAVDSTTFAKYIRAIFISFVWSVGILATVMTIYGGVRWVAAAGDASRINQAKDIIYNAIIGLVITLTSVVLLNLIDPRLVKFEGLSSDLVTEVEGVPYETDTYVGLYNEAGEERPDPTDPSKTIGGCKSKGQLIGPESSCILSGKPFIWPVGSNVPRSINDGVGPRPKPKNAKNATTCHAGTDFRTAQATGKAILAMADGKITSVSPGLGEYFVRFDGNGYYLVYIHIKQAVVKAGQNVRQGELIGYSGGDPKQGAKQSGGPHLHLNFYTSDNKIHDPVPCIQS